jgi:DnaJ family protein A protein 2
MDYYKVLGVNENSSDDEIKKSYRKLSLKHHPDRGGDANEFKKINEAYQTLGNPNKRQMYKMNRGNPFGGFGGIREGELDPIFKMFFGGAMPGMPGMHGMPGMPGMGHAQVFVNGRPLNMNSLQKPTPIIKTITIPLAQSFSGLTYPLQIERWIMINNVKKMEKEKIYVKINKGVDSGEIIIIRNKGNIINETLKGDIKLFIKVENRSNFKREGINLKLKKTITLKESLTGFRFELKHMNGKTYTINNDSGNIIPSNYIKEIDNLGMTREDITGKLIIEFDIIFPEKLTKEQIDKLKEIL